MHLCMLDSNARSHDFAIEHRVLFVFHQYRFYEYTYLADVPPKVSPLFPMVNNLGLRNDYSNVNIAVRIGITLSVGTVHDNLRVAMIARGYHSFELSDDVEGLFSCKRCLIHCINSFVV